MKTIVALALCSMAFLSYGQTLSNRQYKKALNKGYRSLNDLLIDPYTANANMIGDFKKASSALNTRYKSDTVKFEWCKYDSFYFSMARFYAESLLEPNLAKKQVLIDSAALFQTLTDEYNSFEDEWFYADLISEAREQFVQDNLFELVDLRLNRVSQAESVENYIRLIHALVDLAQVQAELGQFSEALENITLAISEISEPQMTHKSKWDRYFDKELKSKAFAQGISIYLLLDSIVQAQNLLEQYEKTEGTVLDYRVSQELYVAKANVLLSSGKYVKALNLLDAYIQDTAYSDEGIFALIAMCYQKNGTADMAELFFRKSLTGFAAKDQSGLNCAQAHLNMANFFAWQGKVDSCVANVGAAKNQLNRFVEHTFPEMSTGEKQTALLRQEVFLEQLGKLAEYNAIRERNDFAGLLLEFSAMYKGLTLQFQNQVYDFVMADSNIGFQYYQYVHRLSSQSYAYPTGRNKYYQNNDATNLEREINKQCIAAGLKMKNIDYRDLAKGLDSASMLIDYVFVGKKEGSNKYASVMLNHMGQAQIYSVFLDTQIRTQSQSVQWASRGVTISVRKQAFAQKSAYRLLAPVGKIPSSVSRLFISPAGSLYEIPFHVLFKSDSIKLTVNYMLSPTALINASVPWIKTDTLRFRGYGNADYQTLHTPFSNKKNIESKCEGIWKGLPGTKTELGEISRLFSSRNLFTEEQFTESAFRAYYWLDYKKQYQKYPAHIVHIASHGFYMSKSEGNFFESSYHPLIRCGILASGANCTWNGDSARLTEIADNMFGYDGVITGQEISVLDMHGTRLVVLSACETARGASSGLDGPVGLPKAFKMAGVDYVMVALWPVSDEETVEFMSLYYKKLKECRNIETALTLTQNECQLKGMSMDTWAAFVLYQ